MYLKNFCLVPKCISSKARMQMKDFFFEEEDLLLDVLVK